MADLGNGYTLILSYSVGATGTDNKAPVSVTATVRSTNNAWSSDNWPGTLSAGVSNVGSNSKSVYSQSSWSDISQSYDVRLSPGSYTVYASYDRGSTSSSYAPYYSKTDTAGISVAAAVGTLDVNPIINGTEFPSGKAGFTFNVSGNATATNVTDFYQTDISPGSCTATPNAKVGYTTTSATGNVTAGSVLTLKPTWTSKSTTITLNSDGASSHGTTSVTGRYDQAMPTITPPSRSGADFLGYYSQTSGGGTKYYNADGSSAHVWDNANSTVTLYAYWDFHDFLYVSKDGDSYELAHMYVSKDGGPYTLLDAGSVKVSQNGGNYTPIV